MNTTKERQKRYTKNLKEAGGRIIMVRLPADLTKKLARLCRVWNLSGNAALKKLIEDYRE